MSADEIRILKNKSIIDVNAESDCLPVATVFGIALLEDNLKERYNMIRSLKRYPKKLKRKVKELIDECNLNRTGEHSLEDVKKIQEKHPEFRFCIYNDQTDFKSTFFRGEKTAFNSNKVINLFFSENHFSCIKSPKAFFAYNYQCTHCDELHNNKAHRCSGQCKYCRDFPPCKSTYQMTHCVECNKKFRGQKCFDNHKTNGNCKDIIFCGNCFKLVDSKISKEPHDCNNIKCEVCNKIVAAPHFCYIQPYTLQPPDKFSIIFFDFESEFIELPNGYTKHEPNLCVTNTVCHLCYQSSEFPAICQNCKKFEEIFESDDNSKCVQKFVDYVLTFRKWKVFVIAHNSKSYDAQFVLEELCARSFKIEPVLIGRKILSIKVDDITFIDSISFIPFALSKFGSSFGLQNASKGEYPYRFNRAENRNYVGPYPPIEMYPINAMTEDRYNEFIQWYDSQKEKTFNNKEELRKYCAQDVCILRKGCLKFMIDFQKTTGINPFLQSITIADAVMKVYRQNYLIPNTLPILPKNNYASSYLKLQSRIGRKWLLALKELYKVDLIQEYKLPNSNLIVDGYDIQNKVVYEFEGCFTHGHICILNRSYRCSSDSYDTIENRFDRRNARKKRIEEMGYTYKCIWECEFKEILKYNPHIEEYLDNHSEIENATFDLRAAVYGGRTEVFRLYHKIKEGEKILYYDFTSLYPWANKYTTYFKGHPKIFKDIENPSDVLNFNGVAKCSILPPKDLYLPCLPFKCNGRLLFPLCAKCALVMNVFHCDHTEEERMLSGYWSIEEIRLADRYGYRIVKCHEIWSYEIAKYDRENGETGLFAKYVDTFLKIKQEASGWPENCSTKESKLLYIQNYFEKEGIKLDENNIEINKGLRSLAKLMLNSLWGKFVQRDNLTKTIICNSVEEFNELLHSPGIYIRDIHPCGPDQIFISYSHLSDTLPITKHVSVGVGICTTTNARIALYDVMSKLGRDILYCDTDSVLFILRKGKTNPLKTGSYLGELTDELSSYGENSYIEEYVSLGPKTYALKIFSPKSQKYYYKTVCKGITLNRSSTDLVNFNTMKDMVKDCSDSGFREVICRDKIMRAGNFGIVSKDVAKKLQFTFNKRKVIDDYDTIPYGYS